MIVCLFVWLFVCLFETVRKNPGYGMATLISNNLLNLISGTVILLGPEHTGHFVQPHVAAHCGGPEHTRATCGGDMYVMYANALSVAGTSHSLSLTWATNCSVLAKAWK